MRRPFLMLLGGLFASLTASVPIAAAPKTSASDAKEITAKAGKHRLLVGGTASERAAAAQAVARESQLKLRRLTLREVIGPDHATTERNLKQIFADARKDGALLFLDEADALFGKRSEVKDSHDRFANVDTSFLLQMLESYDGMLVLTSNFEPVDPPATIKAWPRVNASMATPTTKP